ncbi:MAG TPA: hypothetical protein VHZ33_14625 [Trebonia sp.]|jgi:hypothetical protein|nr:hypothetical protein [Trebonia sp.]
MPDEEPHQHRDQHPEVHGRVVQVGPLREQRVREHEALDRDLARQPERPLGVPDPPRVPQRLVEPACRQVARELPERVERGHDPGLARERPDVRRPPRWRAWWPARPQADPGQVHQEQPGREEPGREHGGLLPGEHYVRHGN